MRRTHGWLSLLLLPVTVALIWTALGLPDRAYTGFVLRGDHVEEVMPGSPAERAGIRVGDRVVPSAAGPSARGTSGGMLSGIRPGRSVTLHAERGGIPFVVRLVPGHLPRPEFRLLALLLMVAFGFVMLASVVWSERRDALTGRFYLLSLAFAILVSPHPQWPWARWALGYEAAYAGITLFLPALFIHFFVLFPESDRPSGPLGAGVSAGYALATLLFALTLASLLMPTSLLPMVEPVMRSLDMAAALWFAAGVLVAAGLFVRSFRAAGSGDARRRLRVALAGTLLGVAPLVAVILSRSLSPGTPVPGERVAVVLTLLVPASFAWAIVVHRIFDMRIALRALGLVGLLALGGVVTLVASDRVATALGRSAAEVLASRVLSLMALGAAAAGGLVALLRPRVRVLGQGLMAPAASARGLAAGADLPMREALLDSACRSLVSDLRLTGCAAVDFGAGAARPVATAGALALGPLGPGLAAALAGSGGVVALEQVTCGAADRDALDLAGVRWLLPLGIAPMRIVMLLGGRLAGSWLARHEVRELERFAAHLETALENLELRSKASTHVAFDREMREARSIQTHFLPRRVPAFPTLDCAAAALSCEPVGGDYYDFIENGGRDFTIAVGDAAGKGVPAALLLAGVQARFRNEARRGLGPSELLQALNRQLVQLEQPEKFVGLLCARVDVRQGRIGFANAGLTPPLIRRRDGRFEEVTAGGVLLGVSSEAAYRDSWLELARGDVALLYTDGLTEARRGEDLFGVERVAAVLGAHAGRRASEIL
ncbi:MAG: SpoIIE family protein phosphatase, partial [Candidatus Eisenbacteria bacterium]